MSITTRHVINYPRATVWDFHTRPGAVTRLTPPFLPMTVVREADNLASGVTTFSLPAGLRWVAQHELAGHQSGQQFVDVCVNAPLRTLANWRHTHRFDDVGPAATAVTDTVTTRVPAHFLTPTFAFRQHQLANDLAAVERMAQWQPTPITIAITGASGSVGRDLQALLTVAGHTVIPLVRSQPVPDGARLWQPNHPDPRLLDGVDVLVHLAGEPIFGRFNDNHKTAIYDSRVGPTKKLARLVTDSPTVTAMVSASAIGFYGPDRGDEELSESSERGSGFLADVVSAWEESTTPAADAGKRVVNVRTGLMMSGGDGMLPMLAALFFTGLGGHFGDGSSWASWVSRDDLTDFYARAILDASVTGPINAVSPTPVRGKEQAKILAAQLNRPARIPLPTFGPALLLGKEGAEELALASQKVLPAALPDFHFRYPTLAQALAHELGNEEIADVTDAKE